MFTVHPRYASSHGKAFPSRRPGILELGAGKQASRREDAGIVVGMCKPFKQ